ncbi:large ribosomal subunit protein mL65 [Panulirus ornatus]|uniref:large ribosomal subunit protein mL65 n=1 Tax=Panulirus ornatus TaxID=150431 RepID=UPI003A889B12
MPKYYGYWSLHLTADNPTLSGAEYTQFATRTHLEKSLPVEYYSDVKEEAERITPLLKDQVEQLIHLNFNGILNRRNFGPGRASERHRTQNFLFGLHRIMASTLESSVQHIKESVVDVRPQIEAFWILGGIPPDRILKKARRNSPQKKDIEHEPIDRPVQGKSNPFLGVRVIDGLPEVVGKDDPMASSGTVPNIYMDPRAFGFRFKHKHATTVTGFWPGEAKQHSQLWLHTRELIPKFAQEYGPHNADAALVHKLVVASFSQALAHATYLGFGPVTELTYPIVQQSAITDGQQWNFSVYQLNTCALHSDRATVNPYNNILWLSEEQSLFEAVDNGGVKGFNPEVLTRLVAMYLKKGITRENPTPYLGPFKHLADHPASEEYRELFRSSLHHLLSNRPRHIPKPEIYLWEKIYKCDYKTRLYEPPRRFFENHYKKKDPGMCRLDEHNPKYIPKALRKSKQIKHMPKIDSEHLFKYD